METGLGDEECTRCEKGYSDWERSTLPLVSSRNWLV